MNLKYWCWYEGSGVSEWVHLSRDPYLCSLHPWPGSLTVYMDVSWPSGRTLSSPPSPPSGCVILRPWRRSRCWDPVSLTTQRPHCTPLTVLFYPEFRGTMVPLSPLCPLSAEGSWRALCQVLFFDLSPLGSLSAVTQFWKDSLSWSVLTTERERDKKKQKFKWLVCHCVQCQVRGQSRGEERAAESQQESLLFCTTPPTHTPHRWPSNVHICWPLLDFRIVNIQHCHTLQTACRSLTHFDPDSSSRGAVWGQVLALVQYQVVFIQIYNAFSMTYIIKTGWRHC